jgi:hypothetical protein
LKKDCNPNKGRQLSRGYVGISAGESQCRTRMQEPEGRTWTGALNCTIQFIHHLDIGFPCVPSQAWSSSTILSLGRKTYKDNRRKAKGKMQAREGTGCCLSPYPPPSIPEL